MTTIEKLLGEIQTATLTPEQLKDVQSTVKKRLAETKTADVEEALADLRGIENKLGEVTLKAGYSVWRKEKKATRQNKDKTVVADLAKLPKKGSKADTAAA